MSERLSKEGVGLGIGAMRADFGFHMRPEILTGATAAKGIASRTGLGATRHIEVHY